MSVFPTKDEFHEGKELLVLFITVAPELRNNSIKICGEREWRVMENFIAKVTSKLRPEGWVRIGQRKHGQEGLPTTKKRCA